MHILSSEPLLFELIKSALLIHVGNSLRRLFYRLDHSGFFG